MADSKAHESDMVWMSGSFTAKDLHLKRAIVREGLSKLTETTVEFQSKNKAVKLEQIVGQQMNLHVARSDKKDQQFSGLCISVENMGFRDGYGHYVAEVRPWFWMLTRTSDSRVFQNLSTVEIIKKILGDHGFSDFRDSLSDSYKKREYCLQYRETDYDFICRLMEEEGIYFYFDSMANTAGAEKLVLCDGISAHSPIEVESKVTYQARDDSDRRREDHIAEWTQEERITTGKVTLADFDFTSPSADLKVSAAIPRGNHSHKNFESYEYQGRYHKDTSLGGTRARVRMEAEAVQHKRWRGASSVRSLGTGMTFSLEKHPDEAANGDYLVIDATHYLQLGDDYGEREKRTTDAADGGEMRRDLKPRNADFPDEIAGDAYSAVFSAIEKSEQFRAPLITRRPEVPGLQTATVVGSSGEEIWTDEHGRIKVQFHWDREGKKNEMSSCFVRVATPWSGKDWGMVAIPRLGQEVVVQFEDGNPDRPICTGMLYNSDTMPPYSFPDNQTQLGFKTNSSKGGNGYNELMFEDKAGSELMRIQAQKDHQMLIKDRSAVTIGLDDPTPDAPGTDEKSYALTVQQNMTETVKQGDRVGVVETGDLTETISKGNHSETVTMGDFSLKVSSGKISMTAAQEILLKVGGTTVKLDPSGVTIKGPMIKIEGQAMVEAKAPTTTVKGDAMLTLKGALTLIN